MATQPNIEDQLRAAILGAGMTRYRIAKLSGVTEATLSLFVHGKRSMTTDTAAKVAAVLGLELRQVRKAGKAGKGRKAAKHGKSQALAAPTQPQDATQHERKRP